VGDTPSWKEIVVVAARTESSLECFGENAHENGETSATSKTITIVWGKVWIDFISASQSDPNETLPACGYLKNKKPFLR